MASQKSTPKLVLSPTRQRGRDRVAALLDAAAAVFAQRGYEAATMTEIASRADTAIGSLYRFFPTKNLLAEQLVERYTARTLASLDQVRARVATLDAGALAAALLEASWADRDARDAADAAAEGRGDGRPWRARVRVAFRDAIRAVLLAWGVPAARADAAAAVVLGVLKALPSLVEDGTDEGAALAELRRLLAAYLAETAQGLRP